MVRERPTAVLVMAILNMVFGGLGLIINLCGGIGLLVMTKLPMPAAPGGGNPIQDMFSFMEKEMPGYKFITIAMLVLGACLAVVLIVAGIGLLRMQPWARWASVFYGVVAILTQLGGLIFNVAVANPAMERWQREFSRAQGPNAPPGFTGNSTLSNIGSAFGALFGMAYAIALLIVLLLPHVSAAFARRPARQYSDEDPRYDDEDDYDRGGRRLPRSDDGNG